jgi:DNA-binding IclR family transcriptional regulator
MTAYVRSKGYPPTYNELSEMTGYPVSTVHRYCSYMTHIGVLRTEDTAGRKYWPV